MRECASVRVCVTVYLCIHKFEYLVFLPISPSSGKAKMATSLSPPPRLPLLFLAHFVVVLLWRFVDITKNVLSHCRCSCCRLFLRRLYPSPSPACTCAAHFPEKLNATLRRRDSIAWLMLIICYSTGEKRRKMQENGKNRSGKHTYFWKTRTWDVQLLAISGRTAPKK